MKTSRIALVLGLALFLAGGARFVHERKTKPVTAHIAILSPNPADLEKAAIQELADNIQKHFQARTYIIFVQSKSRDESLILTYTTDDQELEFARGMKYGVTKQCWSKVNNFIIEQVARKEGHFEDFEQQGCEQVLPKDAR